MIFDERDLIEEKTTDKKEKIQPLKEQMSFEDIKINAEEIKEVVTEEELEETSEEEEVFVEQKEEDIIDEHGNLNKGLKQVIHESMIPYSEYVILDRALPRVEDGLKPVQRRILYSMYELGLTPDKPFKKSAKVVGDCMANYHPHGDSSVYNAMVRMSQDFNMRDPLVKGHGNFGSMDGDSAAAMRYTEAKLSDISMELLKDINKDTVKWNPNYDDSKKEPDMLPGRFPNLLVNGSSGIAVGLATNIPPHNLGETIDGVVAYIDDKKISLPKLMKHIKGPDFPMGGIILGTDGIKDAYETGKGKIIVRAKTHMEGSALTKRLIVIDEFPYQVNKADLLTKIASLREDNKDILGGIAEIRDESDRNGVRAVIYLKKDADEELILNYLFKHTDLQSSFSVNMVAIADGKPKQLSLLEVIEYYTDYQREVVLRRTKFDLEAAKQREHIVRGILIAIKNIDEVIKIIKSASSTIEAKVKLKDRFDLSEKQAQAVLDMRLARLVNLEVEKLEAELRELVETIEKLTQIVNSKASQMTIVKKELLEIKKTHATKRRTQIIENAEELLDLNEQAFVPVKEVVIAVNEKGCIKKIPQKSFTMTARVISDNSNLNEVHNVVISTETDKTLLIFTSKGMCHKLSIEPILEARWKDRGSRLTELLKNFEDTEKVVEILPIAEKLPKLNLMLFTKNGMVKKTEFKEYDIKKESYEAISLKEGDELVNVDIFDKTKNMTFITKAGMMLNAVTEEVPNQGRLAGGVKGIKLNDSDSVIFAGLTKKKDLIMLVTTKGYCKKIEVNEVDTMAKYRKGVKAITLGMDNGFDLLLADKANHTYEVYVVDDKNKVITLNTEHMPIESRTTKGKIITSAKKSLKIKVLHKYEWEAMEYAYNKKL
jgi:DNA gyrase/topoisomerase IV subunit A